MTHRIRVLLCALAALIAALLFFGCAAGKEAARPEGRAVTVRVPATETFEFTGKAQAPAPPYPAAFFEDDEYRQTGRWLTLFEMNIYPTSTEPVEPPAAPPELP